MPTIIELKFRQHALIHYFLLSVTSSTLLQKMHMQKSESVSPDVQTKWSFFYIHIAMLPRMLFHLYEPTMKCINYSSCNGHWSLFNDISKHPPSQAFQAPVHTLPIPQVEVRAIAWFDRIVAVDHRQYRRRDDFLERLHYIRNFITQARGTHSGDHVPFSVNSLMCTFLL